VKVGDFQVAIKLPDDMNINKNIQIKGVPNETCNDVIKK
jgi:hypothetical protein